MSWTCGNILLFLDSKVNDFHSEADSNDGRSSGKIRMKYFFPFYLFVYLFYFQRKNVKLNIAIVCLLYSTAKPSRAMY